MAALVAEYLRYVTMSGSVRAFRSTRFDVAARTTAFHLSQVLDVLLRVLKTEDVCAKAIDTNRPVLVGGIISVTPGTISLAAFASGEVQRGAGWPRPPPLPAQGVLATAPET